MGIYLNPGNHGFRRALRTQIYVDKSGLLAYANSVLDTENSFLCVSRPRRFGKSIAAEMLVAYYGRGCDSSELFQGLKIAESADYREHLNRYDVIHADMSSFLHRIDAETGECCTPKRAVWLFQRLVMDELREAFPGQAGAQAADLPSTLADVSLRTGRQFVIVIDEWDAIFREDKLDEAAQKCYINLLRGLFKDASAKRFIKLAYLTGILPIKKYGTESALNNFDEFTMVDASGLSEYTGFTEPEVQAICQKYGMDFAEIKKWYDGYRLSDGLHIYNPKSVVDAMRRKRVGSYWTKTETYESLKDYISANFDGLKDSVVRMLAGGRVRVDAGTFENDMTSFGCRDDILTALIHLGYLAYDAETREAFVPNEEVRGAFASAVKKSGWDTVIRAISESEGLLKATIRGDEAAVAERLDAVHQANASILAYNDENALGCIITLAYYQAMDDYTLIREFPSGKGFADVVFLPRRHTDKPAMVVELKWDSGAEGAIAQIKERRYAQSLRDYGGNVLLVGVSYDRKTKKHECRIERAEKNPGTA